MSIFEERGIELQQTARSQNQAQKRLEYSCSQCASRGKFRNCRNCPIESAYNERIQDLKYKEEHMMFKLAYDATKQTH